MGGNMDQIKIGNFIKECRKELGITQYELADKLNVSFKTISKWECGKGLPEVSLFIPLCEELNITVNELLNGCHIDKDNYMEKAEEKLLDNVSKERSRNKKLLITEQIIAITLIIQLLTMALVVSFLEMKDNIRIIMLLIVVIPLFIIVFALCIIEVHSGYFECKHCHERFVPSEKDFIMGTHTLTTRYLKCPKCGKKSFCKKRLSK
jgi:transcriptional regulator with XRE-family HTH domain